MKEPQNEEIGKKNPATTFDYNKLQEETTLVAIKRVWQLFGQNAELLVFKHSTTPEMIVENHSKLAQGILEILIECKVPERDMKFFIENFQVTMFQIFDAIGKQKNEIEKEFLARSIGSKNPGVPHQFSREYTTIGDLFQATMKIRKEQDPDGTNGSYFRMTEKN